MDLFADVFQSGVAHQRTGKQPTLAKDLESVTDADDQTAAVGEFLHILHDGRKLGDGAGAQVVAVGESTGNDDGVTTLEVGGLMPQHRSFFAGRMRDREFTIVVAIRTGKSDDAELHDLREV